LLGPIERRAFAATDESEAGDLGWAAIQLAPPRERLALAVRLDANDATALRDWSLIGALSPSDQLSLLAIRARGNSQTSYELSGAERLESILAEIQTPTRHQAAQVAFVSAVARHASPMVVRLLTERPEAAVGLLDAIDEGLAHAWEIPHLLHAVGRAALERAGASAQVLEVFETRPIRPMPVNAQRAPRQIAPAVPEPDRTLREVLASPHRGGVLQGLQELGRRAREMTDTAPDPVGTLLDELDGLWGERDLRDGISVDGNQATVHGWAEAILRIAPELSWRVSEDRWVQAALCEWLF
jgi:hypothetical protein